MDSTVLRRPLLLAGAVLILLIVFPTLFAILFASAEEISYQAGLSSSTCGESFLARGGSRENCISRYQLLIGNTGSRAQQEVVVELEDFPADYRLGRSVQDIVASARRSANPGISEVSEDGRLAFVIRDLQANKLVTLTLLTRGEAAFRQLQQTRARVSARGSLIEAAPRLTVIGRLARNLLGLF